MAGELWCIIPTASRNLSIKYTQRPGEAGIDPSASSVGDNDDDARAGIINGLLKAEVIPRRGPWCNFEAEEHAMLGWADWSNYRRLLDPIGNIPPADQESTVCAALETEDIVASPTMISLRQAKRGPSRLFGRGGAPGPA